MYFDIQGPEDAPAVLMSSGLGGAAHYWAPNLEALSQNFRVITYDQYGTGRSPGDIPHGYTIAHMAQEAATLLDNLGIQSCHFVGHALGGLIGLELAHRRPSLLNRLVLINAWTKTHPHTLRCFAARRNLLLNTGIQAYVAAQPLFLYPPDWMAARQPWLADQDKAGIDHFPGIDTVLRRIAAIEAFDLTGTIPTIHHPTCVIAASDDMLVPSLCSLTLADSLPNAEFHLFPSGGHACNITHPDRFNARLAAFLAA